MEVLGTVLPVIINVLLIVLLVVCIILIIKCIYIIDKIKAVALNVEEKVNSLNSLFSIITLVSNKVSGLTEKCVNYIEKLLLNLFNKGEEDNTEEVELEVKLEKERKK